MIIDEKGYRLNVGIILTNPEKQVFWAKRSNNQNAWQFPQGGIQPNESPQDAMYRELYEEVGLTPEDVELVAQTEKWLFYDLPPRYWRQETQPLCIGQKQKWFLVKLSTTEGRVCLNRGSKAEFDEWCWVDFWYPLDHVIDFKKAVYKSALEKFKDFVFPTSFA